MVNLEDWMSRFNNTNRLNWVDSNVELGGPVLTNHKDNVYGC